MVAFPAPVAGLPRYLQRLLVVLDRPRHLPQAVVQDAQFAHQVAAGAADFRLLSHVFVQQAAQQSDALPLLPQRQVYLLHVAHRVRLPGRLHQDRPRCDKLVEAAVPVEEVGRVLHHQAQQVLRHP